MQRIKTKEIMIRTSIQKLAKEIAFDIANSDDQIQADLLNGFCEGLANSMQPENLNTQICYIADKLSDKTGNVLKMIVEYVEIKERK